MGAAVGIDLGTTNTVAAAVSDGVASPLPDGEGRRLLPSVVSFHPSGSVLVGRGALERRLIDGPNTIYSVKRLIGRAWASPEVEQARGKLPFELREGPKGGVVVAARGETYSLPEISAFVLRQAKALAEAALGQPVDRAVITVPANFNDLQRAATKTAGRLAGLEVLRILNEPTAAALAYGPQGKEQERIAVYDLGGGTFDVTMIEIKDRLIRVICTGGDHRLGGALWDEAVVLYLAEEFRKQTGETSDPMDDPEVLNDLFLQAERGKKTLTQRDKAPFRVTHAGHQARVELERSQFETITRHLLDRTIELTREMLADAKAKGFTKFDKIILVGGATRMPQVRDRIVSEFAIEPESYDPDEAVAKGAALYGLKESLQDEVRDLLTPETPEAESPGGGLDLAAVSEEQVAEALDKIERELGYTLTGPVRELVNTRIVNVLSKSLGVVALNEKGKDIVVVLLPRNGEVPMESANDFGTDLANQAGVDIRVMAGERDSTEPLDCKDVGVATLNLPPNLPARSPIRVKFAINKDGRLNVTATDLTGGGSIDVDFETEAVMNAEAVAERSSALRLLNVS